MEKFKKGDIVKLKSGGPKMTVEEFQWNPYKNNYDKEKLQCTWFKEDIKYSEIFESAALEKA
ncbi:DUF2158 domain-containing protein [Echinicola jeungdonensis]|uniref:YodC family protein n=1 Tax=Echinicola jeungdonensis TaxID=709343 RepID=A0ABV5J2S2_9BACT|nr:DUF2158 domain-containing protein [Echinicola jeungdonensis]MDN3668150.1 DUF2158 domain-containing protein [Echinicola jeungdonensis]